MQTIVVILVAFVREFVLSRATLQLENIALGQQVAVLKRKRPRPWLRPLDRVFWVFLSVPDSSGNSVTRGKKLTVTQISRSNRIKCHSSAKPQTQPMKGRQPATKMERWPAKV